MFACMTAKWAQVTWGCMLCMHVSFGVSEFSSGLLAPLLHGFLLIARIMNLLQGAFAFTCGDKKREAKSEVIPLFSTLWSPSEHVKERKHWELAGLDVMVSQLARHEEVQKLSRGSLPIPNITGLRFSCLR